MSFTDESFSISRRRFFVDAAVMGAGFSALAKKSSAQVNEQAAESSAYNGSLDPFPIPWLDKNGSHNQSPGFGVDPSSIFHCKGKIARSNNFSGLGTDNRGDRISFGAPSTDFSLFAGGYFAARAPQTGTFSHI